MLIKIKEILNFTNFYELTKNHRLTIKTTYKLVKLAKAIENEMAFYQEKFQSIIMEYGLMDSSGKLVPTDDGAGIKLKPGTESECYTTIQELQDLEIALPDIKFFLSLKNNKTDRRINYVGLFLCPRPVAYAHKTLPPLSCFVHFAQKRKKQTVHVTKLLSRRFLLSD